MKQIEAILVCLLVVLGPASVGHAQDSRAELTPDDAHVLLNKDVAGERWAIARNLGGSTTVTGNVFPEEGGEPTFLWCDDVSPEPAGEDVTLSCFSAESCAVAPCSARDWEFVADVVLPASFFAPDDPVVWDSLGEPILLPHSFFEPPESPEAERESGVRPTLDGARVLVNKDVAGERWAMTRNLDEGTVTGNVFSGAGSDPEFIWCQEIDPPADVADQIALSCYIPGHEIPEPEPEPEPELPLYAPAQWLGRAWCSSKYPGSFEHLNPLSTINDQDLIGACFTCPSGFDRSILPIKSNEACTKGFVIFAEWRPATQVGRSGCQTYGPDAFQNLVLDQCYRCPDGYRRSLGPGIDLTGNAQACRRNEL